MDKERRDTSPLVNALWGRGAAEPVIPPGRVAAARLMVVLVGVFSGTLVGVVAALLDSPLAGAITAAVTCVIWIVAALLFLSGMTAE